MHFDAFKLAAFHTFFQVIRALEERFFGAGLDQTAGPASCARCRKRSGMNAFSASVGAVAGTGVMIIAPLPE